MCGWIPAKNEVSAGITGYDVLDEDNLKPFTEATRELKPKPFAENRLDTFYALDAFVRSSLDNIYPGKNSRM